MYYRELKQETTVAEQDVRELEERVAAILARVKGRVTLRCATTRSSSTATSRRPSE